MTELRFKGKEFVYNHPLAVPFRPLLPGECKGIGPLALDGNLIIPQLSREGDNLHALKALLPRYAGKTAQRRSPQRLDIVPGSDAPGERRQAP